MEYEFLEAHAAVGHGQEWPIEQAMSRDDFIAQHIEQTEKELSDE